MANRNIFNSTPISKPPRSRFDLSYDVKTTLDMGNLVPCMWLDVMPGDSFNISCYTQLRFAPLIAPVMQRFDVTIHYFFVPRRILWSHWQDFIVQQTVDSGVIHPYLIYDESNYTQLMDYLHLPPITFVGHPGQAVDAMPFAAYQLIYNDYYRDENLITELITPGDYMCADADNTAFLNTLGVLRKRAWMHDYFTSALPFAQKGAAVALPLNFEDVHVMQQADPTVAGGVATINVVNSISGASTATVDNELSDSPDINTQELYAQTSLLQGSSTINDLRRAEQLQKWLERNARSGNRYTESLRANFNVTPEDSRLQRPEYITGVKTPVIVSEVLNTTGEVDGLPQGNMSGHAMAIAKGQYGNYFAKEHGILMGIMSVMPYPSYSQGIHRNWFKNDPVEDYPWPLFANIGEQAVLNQEIYENVSPIGGTFGYVPRYSQYKYMPSQLGGNFRNSLDFWTLGRIFTAPPVLNQSFIECEPGKRIFAVTDPDEHSLYVHHLNKVEAVRPLPKYGVPSL